MRIVKRSIKKWGEGYVVLIPTDDQDLWHIYNLIQADDHIKMKSPRKIVNVNQATGLKNIKVKRLTLTLLIVDIDYFSQGDRLAISVKGRNSEQNEYLKLGQYHTFCIELNQKLTIYKKIWPQFECNLLKQISNTSHNVQIGAMVMEQGVAHLCYVKPSITLLVHKIEKNVSKKSAGQQVYAKSLNKFFLDCYRAIRGIDLNQMKCFVIASPGFINEQLFKYIQEQGQKQNDKNFKKDLEKFMLVKCSSGYLQSLNEVLADPKVRSKMENTKAINQSKVLQKFYSIMTKNENMVAYGQKQVFKCIELQAVQILLICDSLFRTKNFKKRMVYNKIIEQVKGFGGEVVVFSTLHPSGQKLRSITGIAAILRFDVIPDDDQEEVQEAKEQNLKKDEQDMQNDLKALAVISDEQEQDEEESQGKGMDQPE